jgi:predicted HTH transcriptional regulator
MYRAIVRRRVVGVLTGKSYTVGQLQDELFDVEGSDVARELRVLVKRGAVKHNGKVGRGSKYHRLVA